MKTINPYVINIQRYIINNCYKDMLIRGMEPPYDNDEQHPLASEAGTYTGGFHDHWTWDESKLSNYSPEDLELLFVLCQESWKQKKSFDEVDLTEIDGISIPVVVELNNTCPSAPSQWEGTLYDGQMIHIRYRFGVLKITSTIETENEAMGVHIYKGKHGNTFDSVMSTEEMINLTKHKMNYERI